MNTNLDPLEKMLWKLQRALFVAKLRLCYFELLSMERYPHTPSVTKRADELERALTTLR